MATVNTAEYLLDQAKRRFTPTVNTIPGMGLLEQRLRNTQFPETILADPPPGHGRRVVAEHGLPRVIPLLEADAFAAAQVDRRQDQHRSVSRGRWAGVMSV